MPTKPARISVPDFRGRVRRGGEFVFPAGDDHAREAVAKDIDRGAAHVHELIDPEKKKQRLGGKMKRTGRGKNDDERRARHAGSAFAADEKREKHHGLLTDREMNPRGLRNEKK